MPTQEERLAALEKASATLQREAATYIKETDENITILLGVIRHQGQDIKKMAYHLETIDNRLDTLEQRLTHVETTLDEHTARFNRLETLLTRILERLPEPEK